MSLIFACAPTASPLLNQGLKGAANRPGTLLRVPLLAILVVDVCDAEPGLVSFSPLEVAGSLSVSKTLIE
jgi:hypothetical protein